MSLALAGSGANASNGAPDKRNVLNPSSQRPGLLRGDGTVAWDTPWDLADSVRLECTVQLKI